MLAERAPNSSTHILHCSRDFRFPMSSSIALRRLETPIEVANMSDCILEPAAERARNTPYEYLTATVIDGDKFVHEKRRRCVSTGRLLV